MDMASYNLIESNLDFVKMLLHDYVDIIFANEEEAKAFTGVEQVEALHKLSEDCPVAIVKVGKDGSYIKMDGEVEDYVVSGSLLNNAGIKLKQAFGGTGFDDETRLFKDFSSRMYFFEKV